MGKVLFGPLFILSFIVSVCRAQTPASYDLNRLLEGRKLSVLSGDTCKSLSDGLYKGVTCSGIIWLKGVSFSTGSIDIDLRGRDVYQQNFLGIAFHGDDTTTYDAIYFRPFNFQTPDTLRHKHMVQYISQPDYPWERLRKEHPLVYENTISPAPMPNNWLHAHIVVTKDEIIVYVDHSTVPSLKVKKLNDRVEGGIGLWDMYYAGDFANLVITRSN
ncbi:MAG TPA: hypothetical protein VFE53_13700 [Mucilaginibacter sp.]|jgi:hypothetical protein|nr:hypothetical protein [Mucilaginibacter sp.]